MERGGGLAGAEREEGDGDERWCRSCEHKAALRFLPVMTTNSQMVMTLLECATVMNWPSALPQLMCSGWAVLPPSVEAAQMMPLEV